MKTSKNLLGGFGSQINVLNTLSGGISMTTVSIAENPHGFVIRMKTPSVSGEAFHVEVNGNQLIVYSILDRPEVNEEQEESSNPNRVVIPSFIKTFPLSELVEKNKIEAIYEEGELKIIVPLKPRTEEKPRRIDIKYN